MRDPAAPEVYVTVAGVEYRVLDGVIRGGEMIVANPPAVWATFRIFRPEAGQRRLTYFTPGESRAPEPALLEHQLKRAEYLPTASFEPGDLEP